jgi:hypothetical protein
MSTCALHFIKQLLVDIGVTCPEILVIEFKLLGVLSIFNANRSSITISQVAEQFYDCISSTLNAGSFLAQQIAYAIFFVLLATALLILLMVTVLYILKDSHHGGVMIGIFIVFIIFYMLTITLILTNAGLNISNNIATDTQLIRNCIDKAIAQLNQMISEDENALSLALCSYPANPLSPCNQS